MKKTIIWIKNCTTKKALAGFWQKLAKNIPNQGVFVVQKINFYAEISFFMKNMLQFYAGCATIHTQLHAIYIEIYIT